MSDQGPESSAARPPRPRWWTVLLIASLALNLLAGGAVATRYFMHERMTRFTGIGNIQLVPRKFLGELPRQRRLELLAVFRGYSDEFKMERTASREAAEKLATALAAEPYDAAAVKAVADQFGAAGNRLISHGVAAAMELIGKLSPQERQQLARHIRQRAQPGNRK